MKLRSLVRLAVPLLAVLSTSGCPADGDTALITVTADAPVQQYRLFVLEVGSDADAGGARTITGLKDGNPGWTPVPTGKDPFKGGFKIGLTFSKKATYWIIIIGATCDSGSCSDTDLPPGHVAHQFFWADIVNANGTVEVTAKLETVMPQEDMDRDLWPSMSWSGAAGYTSANKGFLLDCGDMDMVVTGGAHDKQKVVGSLIAPFDLINFKPIKSICDWSFDNTCGGGTTMCQDADKDGDPDDTDCAPNDPAIHHPNAMDEYPQEANDCGYALTAANPDYTPNPLLDPSMHYPALAHMGHCGTKSYDCSGKTIPCVVDGDCDTYAANSHAVMTSNGNMCAGPSNDPAGDDCNDCDPKINPKAMEICGNGIDDNCNGLVDEGCVSCDLDGDGFQRVDKANGCPDSNNKGKATEMQPSDDYDSGVFPGSFSVKVALPYATANGPGVLDECFINPSQPAPSQGGNPACALRQACKLTGPDGKLQDVSAPGSSNGCPPPKCDADGDGFVAAALANDPTCKPFVPPAIAGHEMVDCDDTDPKSFPFAPPDCHDMKNEYHTCGSWGPTQNLCPVNNVPGMFGLDSDGDGYPDQMDCDPNDSSVHPFALEICDNKDNDCDGLVDENNIDIKGSPMVTAGKITACNDSNKGACKPTTGICVCTHIKAADFYDDSNLPSSRVACPGETAAYDTHGAMDSAPAPRCYFAYQPKPQSCNPTSPIDDDCDGRVDAPDGLNANGLAGHIADFGKICLPSPSNKTGVNQCAKAQGGKVIGCKQPASGQMASNCFAEYKGGVAPTNINPWFVCSTDGKNPIDPATTDCPHDEKCNGFDDDCNDVLPVSEQDKDKDKYIACGSQFSMYPVTDVPGACQMVLASPLLGCGDCNDSDATQHPNAQEICDNVDNDCNPTTADGAQECGFSGALMPGWTTQGEPTFPNCCGLQMELNGTRCRNWKNDPVNCSGCATSSTDAAHVCVPLKANVCVNSGCSCGQAMASPCTTHNWCDAASGGGTCTTCATDLHCTDACVACTGLTLKCKSDGGSVCVQCNVDADCGGFNNNAGISCGTSGCWCDTSNLCQLKFTSGTICQMDDQCLGGHCVIAQSLKRCTSIPDCTQMCQVIDTSGTSCVPESSGSDVKNECPKSPPADGCQQTLCNGTAGTHACDLPNGHTCHTPITSCSGSVATYTETDYACQTGTCTPAMKGCAGYVCGSATCLSSCSGDPQCDTASWCNTSSKCVPKVSNGTACTNTSGDQCISGNCTDAFCCDAACGSACTYCNLATKGTCSTAAEGAAPRTACTGNFVCNGAATGCPTSCANDKQCATGFYCDNAGACVTRKTNGVACNLATDCKVAGSCGECTNFCVPTNGSSGVGVCCNTACNAGPCQACLGALTGGSDGTCATSSADAASIAATCAPYLCSGSATSCPTTCAKDADCVSGDYCDSSSHCAIQKTNGTACNVSTDCKVTGACKECANFCVPNNGVSGAGMCCNTVCNAGACQACVNTLTGKGDGTCGTVSADKTSIANTCSPFLCNGSATSCPTACAKDADCVSGDYCDNNGACVTEKADSKSCNLTTDCKQSGSCQECKDFCVPNDGSSGLGICCNTACNAGSCQGCLNTLTGLADGVCGTIQADKPSIGNACSPLLCEGGGTSCPANCAKDADCISGDYCDNNGTCQPQKTAGTTCNVTSDCKVAGCKECANFCVANNGTSGPGMCCLTACTGHACQACLNTLTGAGDGTCANVLADKASVGNACTPYLCGGATNDCPTTCAKDADCVSGDYCDSGGHCQTEKSNGTGCNLTADCKVSGGCKECVNFCAANNGTSGAGMCCNTACNAGACQACLNTLTGKGDGTCGTVLTDHSPINSSCGAYLCDGSGTGCPTMCMADADCVTTSFCDNSTACSPKKGDGTACNLTTDCAMMGSCNECTNFCVPNDGVSGAGMCCNLACSGACQACVNSLTGAANGTCAVVLAKKQSVGDSCKPYLCDGVLTVCPTTCANDTFCETPDPNCNGSNKCSP